MSPLPRQPAGAAGTASANAANAGAAPGLPPPTAAAPASGAAAAARPPVVILLGPSRGAVSGVSTHLNLLFASSLARQFTLVHFQVGSEGRDESLAGRLLRLLASPLLLAAKIVGQRAAIVHINTSLNPRAFWRDLAHLLAARLCGARVVYQIHGGALPRAFAADSRLPAGLLRAVLRTVLRLPAAIVVLAQCELAAYREFVPGQRVLLLPNSIDLRPYARPLSDSAPAPAATKAPLRLIYVGRLAADKGLHEALAGIARARLRGVAATLVIAGSGPDAGALQALTRELGLDDEVRFVGPVFNGNKLALYDDADLLILPTYAEGLPYALLESMAAGVPAITTRVGGIPDVVVDGIHGLFVPVRDEAAICRAIERLAHDRALLARMSIACRRRIAHGYTIERLAGDFARLYRQIGARRAGIDEAADASDAAKSADGGH
ncbi:MAG TPA: glycosyltransferase family 4 protein [Azospira sp.]|nr:glycosyltransferase family 4 protein [Azospira sp.]